MTRRSHLASLLASLALALPLAGQEPAAALKSPLPGFPDGKAATSPIELKITSPEPDEVIALPAPEEGKPAPKGAEVVLRFEVKGYELFQDPQTKLGQYIQILLDGQMRGMHFLADKGWVLKNIPPGTHNVRAYLARPWHEAVKEPGAFAQVTFHVGEKSPAVAQVDPTAPTLTLVRPRGRLRKADAGKVLFDVFVTGCKVSDAKTDDSCVVRYRLDDRPEETLTSWAPVFFETLAPGRHAIQAALSRDGKFLPGTALSAAFEIEADAPAQAAAPGPGTGGTGSTR